MKVLFVCTGNICRSPMGELMFPLFFHADNFEMNSAGTQGLIDHPIDPSSGKLMAQDGIDAQAFRSKRLTPQLALNSDLILCFTERQQRDIVTLAPRAARKTFLLNDFANLCTFCNEQGFLRGTTVEQRAQEVMDTASMIRHVVPKPADIEDPFQQEFKAFESAHEHIGNAIAAIAAALEPARGSHAAA